MTNVTRRKHTNSERTVKCPVEGCDKEVLARGINLHVRRSKGNGHGEQGDMPPDIDLSNLETVGQRDVDLDYPSKRNVEKVARQCPYCQQTFSGKHGMSIHFGQVVGRKNHPKNRDDFVAPEEAPVVHLDEAGNIIERADSDAMMPSTERRQDAEGDDGDDATEQAKVERYIKTLEAEGKDEEANRARQMLAD